MGYTHYITYPNNVDEKEFIEKMRLLAKLVKESPVPLRGGDGEGNPLTSDTCIWFNGDGEDAHETFAVNWPIESRFPQFGKYFFCKTARKPYDLVVVGCLGVLAELDGVVVESDGCAEEWEEGIEWASRVLERPVKNPIAESEAKSES